MFLNNLKANQKDLFLQLAIRAAEVNGIVSIEEKNMLKAFSIEMNIAPVYKTEKNFEDIVEELNEISSECELRIVLFEILGILVSDSDFDEMEKKFISYIAGEFKIESATVDLMIKLLNDYASVYSNIVGVVMA